MSYNNKQDKKYAASRSRIGSMSFDEIKKWNGIDVNPDDMVDPSGASINPDDGKVMNTYPDQNLRVRGNSN